MNTVTRIWNGDTCVCIASGPSLTAEDVDYVRGKARTIVINTSYTLALWADVMYAADFKVWKWHKGAKDFPGLKYSLTRGSDIYGVTVLRRGVVDGLSLNPAVLNTGQNSGYQAINLAVHLGASRILLLGYDMQRGPKGEEHWHGDHPNSSRSPYERFRLHFQTLVEPLKSAVVQVVNCSRRSSLTCFPMMPLREALAETAVAA